MQGSENLYITGSYVKDDIGIRRKEQIVECLMRCVIHGYLNLTVEGLA